MFVRVVTASILIAATTGCHSHEGTLREPDVYEGCANDELWRTFDDAITARRVQVNDVEAPLPQTPTSGARLPASPPPTFAWHQTPTNPGSPTGDVQCAQCTSCGQLGTAHLPAVSGDAYDLHFLDGGELVFRAVTTLQTFTPSQSEWTKWRGHALTLQIARARLKANDVLEGPFAPTMSTGYSVEP